MSASFDSEYKDKTSNDSAQNILSSMKFAINAQSVLQEKELGISLIAPINNSSDSKSSQSDHFNNIDPIEQAHKMHKELSENKQNEASIKGYKSIRSKYSSPL